MATTYEDVLNLFRETDRKFQDTERRVESRGLFGIRATGQSASIQNAPTFTPRAG